MKTIEHTIIDADGSDHEYEVTLFGADYGLDLFFDLQGIAGNPLGKIIDAFSGGLDSSINGAAVGQGLTQLAEGILKAGGSKLADRILASTKRDGKKLAPKDISEVYSGNYAEEITALGHVLKDNYSSLLSGPVGKALTALQDLGKSAIQSRGLSSRESQTTEPTRGSSLSGESGETAS